MRKDNPTRTHRIVVMMHFLRLKFPYFGLAGVVIVVVCTLIAALFYQGFAGEPYSLLHHFISELGEVGVSPLAWVFNLGLILGGLFFIPFIIGLGLSLPGWLAKLGMIAGIIAGVSLSGVGVFPMDNLQPHIVAAMTFFRSGLAAVVIFGLAIQLQPKGQVVLDKRVNIISLLAAASYAGFILYSSMMPLPEGAEALDPGFLSERPTIWPLAVIEWSIFFTTILWFGAIALAGRRNPKP